MSSTRSQRDTAPSRAGPKAERAARRRRRLGVVVDRQLERAEMALGRADGALHDGKSVTRGGATSAGGLISTVTSRWSLSRLRRLDRLLVAAIDQDHALAGQADEGKLGRGLGGRREQRRHLGPAPRGVASTSRRSRGYWRSVTSAASPAISGEQRRFLGAADDERLAACRRGAELLELGAAELARGRNVARRDSRAAPRRASSGIVSSHEQIKIFGGRSAISSPVCKAARGVSSASRAGLTGVSIRFARTAFAKEGGWPRNRSAEFRIQSAAVGPATTRNTASSPARYWSWRIAGYNHYKQLSRVREPKCRSRSARACIHRQSLRSTCRRHSG